MKTKKLILVIFLTFIGAIGAYAQKTNVRMQETQARLLDVTSNAYVKPLTVELQIDKSKGRIKDEWTLTREQAEQEMNATWSTSAAMQSICLRKNIMQT